MHQSISLSGFRDAFIRADRKESFSYDGLEILFEYLEQYEEETGERIELDVIGLCGDFAEDSPECIAENYSIDVEGLDESEVADTVRDHLENEGAYIGTTDHGQIVYRQY